MENKNSDCITGDTFIEIESEASKHCGNCNKQFQYGNVKERYPESFHNRLKELWHNKEIKFYCSSCYFLKLIRQVKKARQ